MNSFARFLNKLIDEAYERGHKWALSCAATALSAQDRAYLEDNAKGMARQLPATLFDPATNPEDKLKAEENDKTLRELDDREMALAQVGLTVRQRERELAELGPDTQAPGVSTGLVVSGTALFAVGFALGIYDWVHDRLPDPYLAGLVALVPSVALGMFVVHSLTHADSPQKRTLGLAAGIGISVATGVLRYAFSSDEIVLATALTLLELFIVAFLDWQGTHLQARHQKWRTEHEARSKAKHSLAAVLQQYKRVSDEIADLQQKKATHLEEITVRSLCSQKLSEIEDSICKAIIAGAHKGISENQGLKRGVMPPANTTPAVLP
jgi:hypothetical protein